MIVIVECWLGVDVGGERKGFDAAIVSAWGAAGTVVAVYRR